MIRISEPKREIATLAGDRVGALGPPLWSRMWGSGGAVGGILNQWGSGGGGVYHHWCSEDRYVEMAKFFIRPCLRLSNVTKPRVIMSDS